MKFFLVISIIAFWWVPSNTPGNIGILNIPVSKAPLHPKTKISTPVQKESGIATKRKMDHFRFQFRKSLIKMTNQDGGK